jgi:2-polyprenyl-3-methyl-5-hydroxy-6-metoxy-1,4-benzoquinol methylase
MNYKIFEELEKINERPEPFEFYTASDLWTDEYTSKQMLSYHLNEEVDLSSRNRVFIEKSVEWIASHFNIGPDTKIADFGCGPGLYTERLAEAGHRVTGVDFSANSIRHARASAAEKKLAIDYRGQNYLTLDAENEYDLVMMIFTDFGVLLPHDRTILLEKVHRALKPGGKFIFDVLNDRFSMPASREWDMQEKGFWKDAPYLALSETFHYELEKVILSQHVVIDEKSELDVYRFWAHRFSDADVKGILSSMGFSGTECFSGVIPNGGGYRSEDVTFCVTGR